MDNKVVEGAFEVSDGMRTLRFDGTLISTSDSHRHGAQRWVEFSLYRTRGGSYVLSRIGRSLLFHRPDCDIVHRNNLEVGAVPPGGAPCDGCRPTPHGEVVCPERPRFWAVPYPTPEGVLIALHKRDATGAAYLTRVAQRLAERAAEVDPAFARVWHVQFLD